MSQTKLTKLQFFQQVQMLVDPEMQNELNAIHEHVYIFYEHDAVLAEMLRNWAGKGQEIHDYCVKKYSS